MYKYDPIFFKMLRALTGLPEYVDQIAHAGASGTAALLIGLQVIDHDGALPGVVGMVGATVLAILSIYHLLIALQFILSTDEVEESKAGERLRNTLSSAATIVVLGALGHEVVKMDGYEADGVNMFRVITYTIIVMALRGLDPLLDKGAGGRGLAESLKIRCNDDNEMGPAVKGLSARSILIHLLLAGSVILLALHHDQVYKGSTDDSTKFIYIILYILIGVHVSNYAVFAGLAMVGGLPQLPFETSGCADDEVKALTRVPLIRQALTTAALSLLSYLVGAFYPDPRVEFLIGATVLYAVADSVGRNYL